MFKAISKVFDPNQRELKRLQKIVDEINAWEPEIQKLSDDRLRAKTQEFREKLGVGKLEDLEIRRLEKEDLKIGKLEGKETGSNHPIIQSSNLQSILPQAFAVAREAIRRVVNERAFDVQLMAAIALHQGKIAEQKTGEGKTHAAAIAMYLNALGGRGVHLVTVNDYLARRDAGWYGQALTFLGLKVGCIIPEHSYLLDPTFIDSSQTDERLQHLRPVSRQETYQADITYGTNNEFGFDYLRDNMVPRLEMMVQTNATGKFGVHHFAIVDEVDFALIDEARTPLIISAPAEESNELYVKFASLAPKLSLEDYKIDEKMRSAHLTDLGVKKMEKWLSTPNLFEDFTLAHHLDQALKAQLLYQRDKDYIVKDNEVIIVDEFTGRLMEGRRYSEGLHQAIEAKERVPIQKESKTLATITFQNYFRMYEKLAGMTGTAATEAEEFHKIYGLDVVQILTHKKMIREDHEDLVYKHQRAKWKAIADEIEARHKIGQPVLVGTTSVEKNQLVSELLQRRQIPHEVLNAKNHTREAEIIVKAGERGAITVATNMAGRGTDIRLGQGVIALGGLFVLGTERHEARRIDNQLRGRSGRQGDPGESRFFVGLDDDLMRIFGGEKIANLMTRFNLPEDVPIESSLVSKSIENAQIKVEGYNFDIRKHLVEYDDVINKQREIIYARRRRLLEPPNFPSDPSFPSPLSQPSLKEGLVAKIQQYTENPAESVRIFEEKEKRFGSQLMEQVMRAVSLSTLDQLWMEHIDALDELRIGIGLRGYGQRDPLIEFKQDAYKMFEALVTNIDYEIVQRVLRVEMGVPIEQLSQEALERARAQHVGMGPISHMGPTENTAGSTPTVVQQQQPVVKPENQKLGRNDPCWCGSGLKYKKCHGKNS